MFYLFQHEKNVSPSSRYSVTLILPYRTIPTKCKMWNLNKSHNWLMKCSIIGLWSDEMHFPWRSPGPKPSRRLSGRPWTVASLYHRSFLELKTQLHKNLIWSKCPNTYRAFRNYSHPLTVSSFCCVTAWI